NSGTIFGAFPVGVKINFGGLIVNNAQGLIEGYIGAGVINAAGSIDNSGTILGTGSRYFGAQLGLAGGVLTNNAGGLIAGGSGVFLIGGGSLGNAGRIIGTHGAGIYVGYAGFPLTRPTVITNTGTVEGTIGIRVGNDTADNTLANAGAVIGHGGTAVAFGSGNDRLVVDPGAVFDGRVDGGAGLDALELAPGTGSLAGLGTGIVGFETVTVDNGAVWTLTGNSVIAAGASLANGGLLSFTGTLDLAGAVTGGLGFGGGDN